MFGTRALLRPRASVSLHRIDPSSLAPAQIESNGMAGARGFSEPKRSTISNMYPGLFQVLFRITTSLITTSLSQCGCGITTSLSRKQIQPSHTQTKFQDSLWVGEMPWSWVQVICLQSKDGRFVYIRMISRCFQGQCRF